MKNEGRRLSGQFMSNALSTNIPCYQPILSTEFDDEQFEEEEVDELPEEMDQDEYDE